MENNSKPEEKEIIKEPKKGFWFWVKWPFVKLKEIMIWLSRISRNDQID